MAKEPKWIPGKLKTHRFLCSKAEWRVGGNAAVLPESQNGDGNGNEFRYSYRAAYHDLSPSLAGLLLLREEAYAQIRKKKNAPWKPGARDAEERKQRAGFRKINCASKIAQVASYEDLMEQLGSGAAFQKGAL